ncbi:AraC family transcriptional regulator [Mesorhizobium sp. LHD-90]|uniref:helix-turn-helix transcriptional regulator n=1 Tax=Mesorhizobium sp. LHD-90 TaxID=3071414 RepID=UPI0027DF7359|nr:AraC family transcriptional regulator [Mesorhizobium sp. LHD-90]MDQ6432501.1 AraC family transcriptional regulator [Mesorhizobium sp. LHD-90]
MQRLLLSSDALPHGIDDRARIGAWHDAYGDRFGSVGMSYRKDVAFSANCLLAAFGDLGFMSFNGTLERVSRTSRNVAADPRGDFLLGFPRGGADAVVVQRGRDVHCGTGQVVITSNAEPMETQVGPGSTIAWLGLSVPRARLLDVVADADDVVSRRLDPGAPSMRHLMRYLCLLAAPDAPDSDPALGAHIERTLLDLVSLALGARGDHAYVARERGLAAARLDDILAIIRRRFADPGFEVADVADVADVARRLGVSPRYVNALVHDTGRSFAERVMELRLQKAREMLTDMRQDRMKIIDIAFACGFNEVSYFNRCFRRRFGSAPSGLRGARNGENVRNADA